MDARELYKAEEVLDAVFPSRNEAAEIVHPGREPFYFPASAIATQLASILALASATAVGRDQFDAGCPRSRWFCETWEWLHPLRRHT